MKFSRTFLVLAILCCGLGVNAQSRTNRIYAPCPTSLTPSQVAVSPTSTTRSIRIAPCSGGTVTVAGGLVGTPVSVTDNGTTIATNAGLGNTFRTTALTANVTLSNPTNPTDGQRIVWEVIQNASAAKTLAFGTQFGFGAEITGCTISATLSSHNFITAIYNSTATKWYVLGCVTGY